MIAMADDPVWFAGNYEYQVHIFVLTHKPPEKIPKQTNELIFAFVTDGIQSAVRQAQMKFRILRSNPYEEY